MIPAIFRYLPPCAALSGTVRQLQIIHLDFSDTAVVPAKPYWPRPACALAFYPRHPETIEDPVLGTLAIKPRAVLIGQPTSVTNRSAGRDFFVFQVEFQPGALFRLTGIPSGELRDGFVDAEAVFPRTVSEVSARLGATNDVRTMVDVVEGFLLDLQQRSSRDVRPVDRIAARMHGDGRAPMDKLAREYGLSPKQFYRQFIERMGVGPKLYDRISRFDRAMRLKNTSPELDWLSVAIEAGYYDHQHMARDFHAFTLMSPRQFYEREQLAPERSFGIVET